MRGFILDLAVRGKLVEQDPNDGPASVLMKTIDVARRQFSTAGEFSSQGFEILNEPDVPFEIPPNWIWVQLGDVCSKTGSGSTPRGGKSVYIEEGVPFLRSQNVHNSGLQISDVAFISHETHGKMSGTAVRAGDILLNITGGSIGRCCIVPSEFGEANVSQHVAIIRVAVNGIQHYLHQAILSPYFQSFVIGEQTGAGRGGLPKNRMDRIPVALPPLAEQHRIVAKVDELMALCDRLEVAQAERESRRSQLIAASLDQLNQPAGAGAAEKFREHAQFYLSHLPRLTTRPEHVKQLRQTILNLAVRGQLVPQDPTDEPASELLRKVAAQKRQAGPLKTGRDWVGEIAAAVIGSFVAPEGWVWTRIASTVERVTVGYVGPMKDQYVEGGVPFLRSQNVRANRFREDGLISISRKFHQTIAKSALAPGDVVVVRSGNVGTSCVIPPSLPEANCSDLVVVKKPTAVLPFYLCFYLNSLAAAHIEAGTVGVALTHFNTKSVATMPLLLPPLAEQHRIVAKVDELMALCDRLEEQLTAAQTESRRLLEAVLHEAPNGDNSA